MIQLGSFDAGVSESACQAYLKQVEEITRARPTEVADGSDKLAFRESEQGDMSVAEVQEALRSAGFLFGPATEGICGYRTRSAMRLFEEYVRSYENLPCNPDGRFDANSQKHLKRWMDNGTTTEWAPTIASWEAGTLGEGEYAQWLALLEKVKEKYAASPSRMLQLVNGFARATDTRSVAKWDFAPAGNIHLIGVRRNEKSGKFDDVFILLTKGLVFKFQGSTEPGASENPAGLPFLVQGQHDYHFGWHRGQYLALRPQHLDRGVLVVRSKADNQLDEADLANGLEANSSINVHWGGKGMAFDVKNWSEGCQVINGTLYLNDRNELINCAAFAAANNGEIASNPAKTRGAYNVLVDLVTALSGDLPGGTVKYTLLMEEDLELDPALRQGLAEARKRVGQVLH